MVSSNSAGTRRSSGRTWLASPVERGAETAVLEEIPQQLRAEQQKLWNSATWRSGWCWPREDMQGEADEPHWLVTAKESGGRVGEQCQALPLTSWDLGPVTSWPCGSPQLKLKWWKQMSSGASPSPPPNWDSFPRLPTAPRQSPTKEERYTEIQNYKLLRQISRW